MTTAQYNKLKFVDFEKIRKGVRVLRHYQFSVSSVQRSKGQSAVAAAAYQSRDSLMCDEMAEKHDYSKKKDDVLFSKIYAPKDAPSWAQDRERLWNEVEKKENRKNSILSRSFILSLPRDLEPKDWKNILENFIEKEFVLQGIVADLNIHIDNPNNPHVHIQTTVRGLGKDGWSSHKDRDFADFKAADRVYKLRESFADFCNHILLKKGLEPIDHRSYKDQGIELIPGVHLGKSMHALERTGINNSAESLHDEKVKTHAQILSLNAYKLRQDPAMMARDLTKNRDVFTRADIKKYCARVSLNQREYLSLLRLVLSSKELVKLESEGGKRPLYTSMTSLEKLQSFRAERESFTCLAAQAKRELFSLEKVECAGEKIRLYEKEKKIKFTSSQRRALEYLLTEKSPLKNVIGYAGVGKSTLTSAYVDILRGKGVNVIALAPTGLAAKNLEKSCGIKAKTIDSFVIDMEKKLEKNLTLGLKKGSVLLVDEASMVDNKKMFALVKIAKKYELQLALLGDPRQLEAIAGNEYYQDICREKSVLVNQVVRQKNPLMAEATTLLGEGKVNEALGIYLGNSRYKNPLEDRLTIAKDFEQTSKSLIEAWSGGLTNSSIDERIILATRRKEVEDYNNLARAVAVEKGIVDKDGVKVKVAGRGGESYQRSKKMTSLVSLFQKDLGLALTDAKPQSSLSSPDREEREKIFARGDRIVFLKNNSELDVQNGLRGQVLSIGKEKIRVKILGEREEVIKKGFFNQIKGLFGLKSAFEGKDRTVEIDLKAYNNFDYSYATTVHKSQGMTVKNTFFHVSEKFQNKNLTTVALTRHTDDVRIFAQDKDLSQSRVFSRMRSSANEQERFLKCDALHKKQELEKNREIARTLELKRAQGQSLELERGRGGR